MKAIRPNVVRPDPPSQRLGCLACRILLVAFRDELPTHCQSCGGPLVEVEVRYPPEMLKAFVRLLAQSAADRMVEEALRR